MTAHIETPDGFHDALKSFMEQHDERTVIATLKSAIGCYARATVASPHPPEIVIGQLIMALWGDLVNWGNEKELAEAMAKAFVSEHNTIQQSMMRTFCMMCACWVKGAIEPGSEGPPRGVDARNQHSFDLALKLSDESFAKI